MSNTLEKTRLSGKTALVVLSGGQDSTTCLFWALQYFEKVHAVTFDYGQRHSIEIESAKTVVSMARSHWSKNFFQHEIIQVPNCLVSCSPLTSNAQLEKYSSYKEMDAVIGDRVELTFVPMRNTLFLTIAANRAVALGATAIVTGICQEDNANYPDCRGSFRLVMEDAINISLGFTPLEQDAGYIKILAPLMHLSKAESVMLAKDIPGAWDALAYSHTSYDGKYPPTDMNHSNVLRAEGFLKAGLPDPLVLRANKEGLMPLPNTKNYWGIQMDLFGDNNG